MEMDEKQRMENLPNAPILPEKRPEVDDLLSGGKPVEKPKTSDDDMMARNWIVTASHQSSPDILRIVVFAKSEQEAKTMVLAGIKLKCEKERAK